MSCEVCKLMVNYVPILARSIQCFKCAKIIRPTDDWNLELSEEEDEIEIIPLSPEPQTLPERFMHQAEPQSPERTYRPETPEATPPKRQKIRRIKRKRGRPLKRPRKDSTTDKNFQGVVETDHTCIGCNTVQYGDWIECEQCKNWLCEFCVPRMKRFQLRNVSFNCKQCTSKLRTPARRRKISDSESD